MPTRPTSAALRALLSRRAGTVEEIVEGSARLRTAATGKPATAPPPRFAVPAPPADWPEDIHADPELTAQIVRRERAANTARTAGLETRPDGSTFWRDPGNGEFASPGWSTAKAVFLDALSDFAREWVRNKSDGDWLTARDNYLVRMGVRRGEAVKVRFHDEDYGEIRVLDNGRWTTRKVKWERFDIEEPTPEIPRIEEPTATPTAAMVTGRGGAAANRLRNSPDGTGLVELADSRFNRFGAPPGSVLEARFLDDKYAEIVTPDGVRRKVQWARFTDAAPEADTPAVNAPPKPPVDPLVDRFGLGDWEATRPWAAKPDALPEWMTVAKRRRTEIASQHGEGDAAGITVTEEFFRMRDQYGDDWARAVLYHEAGHGLSDRMLADGTAWDLPDMLDTVDHLNGQTTPGEIAAEAYSILNTDPAWLDEHAPRVKALMIAKADEYGYPVPDTARVVAPKATPATVDEWLTAAGYNPSLIGDYGTGYEHSVNWRDLSADRTDRLHADVSRQTIDKPITPDELIAGVRSMLAADAAAARNGGLTIRVPSSAVATIIGDGRFKTQFESGESSGIYGPDMRAALERGILGIPETHPAVSRPVYGMVAAPGKRLAMGVSYGDIGFVLNNDVAERATLTIGDSLGQALPVPIPLIDAADDRHIAGAVEHTGTLAVAAHFGANTGTAASTIYTEAQIHGGVTTGDIAEVVSYRRSSDRQAQAVAKKLGVPFRAYHDGTDDFNPWNSTYADFQPADAVPVPNVDAPALTDDQAAMRRAVLGMGTVDGAKTVHAVAAGYDEPGSVNDALDLDSVTEADVKAVSARLQADAVASLTSRGFDEEFTVWRIGDLNGVVSVTTREGGIGTFGGGTPYRVRRDDVLTDAATFPALTYGEEELHVDAKNLRPVDAAVDVADGRDPNRGQREPTPIDAATLVDMRAGDAHTAMVDAFATGDVFKPRGWEGTAVPRVMRRAWHGFIDTDGSTRGMHFWAADVFDRNTGLDVVERYSADAFGDTGPRALPDKTVLHATGPEYDKAVTVNAFSAVDRGNYQYGLTEDDVADALRDTYNLTQQFFADQGYGPDDRVTLYRGVGLSQYEDWNDAGRPDTLGTTPLTAFTPDLDVAQRYGAAGVVSVEIPVRDLFSYSTVGHDFEILALSPVDADGHKIVGFTDPDLTGFTDSYPDRTAILLDTVHDWSNDGDGWFAPRAMNQSLVAALTWKLANESSDTISVDGDRYRVQIPDTVPVAGRDAYAKKALADFLFGPPRDPVNHPADRVSTMVADPGYAPHVDAWRAGTPFAGILPESDGELNDDDVALASEWIATAWWGFLDREDGAGQSTRGMHRSIALAFGRKANLDVVNRHGDQSTPLAAREIEELEAVADEWDGPDDVDRYTMARMVRANYEFTQRYLADQGFEPDDTITLYRGLGSTQYRDWNDAGRPNELGSAPAAAFTSDRATAEAYAKLKHGGVIEVQVRAGDILALPGIVGVADPTEQYETIVLAPGDGGFRVTGYTEPDLSEFFDQYPDRAAFLADPDVDGIHLDNAGSFVDGPSGDIRILISTQPAEGVGSSHPLGAAITWRLSNMVDPPPGFELAPMYVNSGQPALRWTAPTDISGTADDIVTDERQQASLLWARTRLADLLYGPQADTEATLDRPAWRDPVDATDAFTTAFQADIDNRFDHPQRARAATAFTNAGYNSDDYPSLPSAVTRTWIGTISGDRSTRGFHRLIADEFGRETNADMLDRFPRSDTVFDIEAAMALLNLDYETELDETDFKKLARALYESTQTQLRDAGIEPDDTITLYRGLGTDSAAEWAAAGYPEHLGSAPLAAFTNDVTVADEFAAAGRISVAVRAGDVLSLGAIGRAAEVIVLAPLDRPGFQVTGYRSKATANLLDSYTDRADLVNALNFGPGSDTFTVTLNDRPVLAAALAEIVGTPDSEPGVFVTGDRVDVRLPYEVRMGNAGEARTDAANMVADLFYDPAPETGMATTVDATDAFNGTGIGSTDFWRAQAQHFADEFFARFGGRSRDLPSNMLSAWGGSIAWSNTTRGFHVLAAREFGRDANLAVIERLSPDIESDIDEAAKYINPSDSDFVPDPDQDRAQASLRALYEITQQQLGDLGINPDDTVTLYRGLGEGQAAEWAAAGHPEHLGSAPVSAFSHSLEEAASYGIPGGGTDVSGEGGGVIAVNVRAGDILSVATVGQPFEVLVLAPTDQPGFKVAAYRSPAVAHVLSVWGDRDILERAVGFKPLGDDPHDLTLVGSGANLIEAAKELVGPPDGAPGVFVTRLADGTDRLDVRLPYPVTDENRDTATAEASGMVADLFYGDVTDQRPGATIDTRQEGGATDGINTRPGDPGSTDQPDTTGPDGGPVRPGGPGVQSAEGPGPAAGPDPESPETGTEAEAGVVPNSGVFADLTDTQALTLAAVAQPDTSNPADYGDPILARIVATNGFDARPNATADRAAFDEAAAGSPYGILTRQVTDPADIDALHEGDYWPGTGIHGSGMYFGQSPAADGDGPVAEAVLRPDARVMGADELEMLRAAQTARIAEQVAAGTPDDDPSIRQARLIIGDPGRFAAFYGIDAVTVDDTDTPTVVVLNRGALIVPPRTSTPAPNPETGYGATARRFLFEPQPYQEQFAWAESPTAAPDTPDPDPLPLRRGLRVGPNRLDEFLAGARLAVRTPTGTTTELEANGDGTWTNTDTGFQLRTPDVQQTIFDTVTDATIMDLGAGDTPEPDTATATGTLYERFGYNPDLRDAPDPDDDETGWTYLHDLGRMIDPSGNTDTEEAVGLTRSVLEAAETDARTGRIMVRVPQRVLGAIADDGAIKPQTETGTSEGVLNTEVRGRWEQAAFGLPTGDTTTPRPVYAMVASDNVAVTNGAGYGQVGLMLKPGVADRSTLTLGDSLSMSAPLPVGSARDATPTEIAAAVAAEGPDVIRATRDGDPLNTNYVEAQIHGGVTVDDIAEIVAFDTVTPELEAFAARLGIPVRDASGSTNFGDVRTAPLVDMEPEPGDEILTARTAPAPARPATLIDVLTKGLVDTEVATAMMAPLFNHDLGGGYRSELQRAHPVATSGNVTFAGRIIAPDGRVAGEFSRALLTDGGDPSTAYLTMSHETFSLFGNHRGSGVGTRFLNATLAQYKQNGIDEVTIEAQSQHGAIVMNGAYTWATLGFDWSARSLDGRGRVPLLAMIGQRMLALDENSAIGRILADAADDTDLNDPRFPTPLDVAMDPVGKVVLRDEDDTFADFGQTVTKWYGVMPLSDRAGTRRTPTTEAGRERAATLIDIDNPAGVDTTPVTATVAVTGDGETGFTFGDMNWSAALPDDAWDDAYNVWTAYAGNYDMRHAAAALLGMDAPPSTGDTLGPPEVHNILETGLSGVHPAWAVRQARERVQEAYAALTEIHNGETTDRVAYRGMGGIAADSPIMSLQPGDRFASTLSAFSPVRRSAENYLTNFDEDGADAGIGEGSVLIKLAPGARVAKASDDYLTQWQDDNGEFVEDVAEYVTSGEFEVTAVSTASNGVRTIEVAHRSTTHPLFGEKPVGPATPVAPDITTATAPDVTLADAIAAMNDPDAGPWEERSQRLLDASANVYDFDLGDGLATVGTGHRLDGGDVVIDGIVTLDGQQVGKFERKLVSRPTVDGNVFEARHEELVLDEDQQGHGYGSRFIAASEARYRALGVDIVTVHGRSTQNMNGAYTWAKSGFDWYINPERPLAHIDAVRLIGVQILDADPDNVLGQRLAEWDGEPAADFPTPLDVAMDPIGKQVLLGWGGDDNADFYGIKYLSDKVAPFRPAAAADEPAGNPDPIDALIAFAAELDVELELRRNSTTGVVSLDKIVVPKTDRKKGVGTTVMNRLLETADREGWTMSLTPDTAYGGTSRARLERYYARFGFQRNRGRKARPEISDGMYRDPVDTPDAPVVDAPDPVATPDVFPDIGTAAPTATLPPTGDRPDRSATTSELTGIIARLSDSASFSTDFATGDDRAYAEQIAGTLYTHDLGNGYRSEAIQIEAAGFPGEPERSGIRIVGNMYGPDGSYVGGFTRIVGPTGFDPADPTPLPDQRAGIRVQHRLVQLDEAHQGQGVGTQFVAMSEAAYRDAGFTSVTLSALSNYPDDNGAYTWAKAGYDWQSPSDLGEPDRGYAIESVQSIGERILTEDPGNPIGAALAGWDGTLRPGFPTPLDVANDPVGKRVLLGENGEAAWYGVKNLDAAVTDVAPAPAPEDAPAPTPAVASVTPEAWRTDRGYDPALIGTLKTYFPRSVDEYVSRARRQGVDIESDEGVIEFTRGVLADAARDVASDRVIIRVPPDAARAIVDDGRFKSQHESQSSQGAYAPRLRSSYETDAFGVPETIDPASHPVYGFIGLDSTAAATGGQYGSIGFVLRGDAIADRTTLSIGDSLEWARPVPVASIGSATDDDIAAAVGFAGEAVVTDLFENKPGYGYIEAQVHGGVSTSDIAEIVAFGPEAESAATALAEQLGVPVRVAPDSEAAMEQRWSGDRSGAETLWKDLRDGWGTATPEPGADAATETTPPAPGETVTPDRITDMPTGTRFTIDGYPGELEVLPDGMIGDVSGDDEPSALGDLLDLLDRDANVTVSKPEPVDVTGSFLATLPTPNPDEPRGVPDEYLATTAAALTDAGFTNQTAWAATTRLSMTWTGFLTSHENTRGFHRLAAETFGRQANVEVVNRITGDPDGTFADEETADAVRMLTMAWPSGGGWDLPEAIPELDGDPGALMRAVHDGTQRRLAEAGIEPDDTITLYRGVGFGQFDEWDKAGRPDHVGTPPVAAFTADYDTASNYGDTGVMTIQVRAGDVFSTGEIGLTTEILVLAPIGEPGFRVVGFTNPRADKFLADFPDRDTFLAATTDEGAPVADFFWNDRTFPRNPRRMTYSTYGSGIADNANKTTGFDPALVQGIKLLADHPDVEVKSTGSATYMNEINVTLPYDVTPDTLEQAKADARRILADAIYGTTDADPVDTPDSTGGDTDAFDIPERVIPASPARDEWLTGLGYDPALVGTAPDPDTDPDLINEIFGTPSKITADLARVAEQNELRPVDQADAMDRLRRSFVDVADHVANGNVIVRAPIDAVGGILDDGRFRSQFETGASRGTYNPGTRGALETDAFGIPDTLDPADRPIYAMVATDTTEAGVGRAYGTIGFALKGTVADRTTVTLGDSLYGAHGIPVSRVGDLDDATLAAAVSKNGGTQILVSDLVGEDRTNYVEAQVHGGVTTDDIAAVYVYDNGADHLEVARAAADRLGVPLVDMTGDSEDGFELTYGDRDVVEQRNTPVPSVPDGVAPESADWLTGRGYNPKLLGSNSYGTLIVDRTDEFMDKAVINQAPNAPRTREELEAGMRTFLGERGDMVRNNGVVIRVPPEAAERIVEDGRFKTQHETTESQGAYAPEYRAEFEQAAFGIPTGFDPATSPVYGMVMAPTDDLLVGQGYGNIGFVLRGDRIADRTSISLGDSLSKARPIPIDAIPAASPADLSTAIDRTTGVRILSSHFGDPRGAKTLNYTEAQIHGGVSTEDIAEVVSYMPATDATAQALAERLGVPFRSFANPTLDRKYADVINNEPVWAPPGPDTSPGVAADVSTSEGWRTSMGYDPALVDLSGHMTIARVDPYDVWMRATGLYDDKVAAGSTGEAVPPQSAAEAVAEVAGVLRSTADDVAANRVIVRAPLAAARQIMEGGRFKSQHETTVSQGHYDPAERDMFERDMFGIPEGVDRSKFPVYGFVAADDFPVGTGGKYGDIGFALRGDRIGDRTTLSIGDSLNLAAPVPVTAVDALGDDEIARAVNADSEGTRILRYRRNGETQSKYDYIEAQVHGGVSVDDVAEIVAFSDDPETVEAAQEMADRLGVPFRLVPGETVPWGDHRARYPLTAPAPDPAVPSVPDTVGTPDAAPDVDPDATSPVFPVDDREAIREMFKADLGSGVSSTVLYVMGDEDRRSVTGEFEVNGSAKGVYSFVLNKEEDGSVTAKLDNIGAVGTPKGTGTRFIAHMERTLAERGVTSVSLDAVSATDTGYVGAYVWAKAGYDWQQRTAATTGWSIGNRMLAVDPDSAIGAALVRPIDRVMADRNDGVLPTNRSWLFANTPVPGDYPTPLDVAMDPVGKQILLGKDDEGVTGWAGVKNLVAAATPSSDGAGIESTGQGAALSLPDINDGGPGWERIGGQSGSNPGALFRASDGTEFYVKQTRSESHNQHETLANALYRMAGVDVPDIVNDPAQPLLLGSKIVPGESIARELGNTDAMNTLRDGFVVDAWLANWDVIGDGVDNVKIDDTTPYRVDAGGALGWRARGGPKGDMFGSTVTELDSMRGLGAFTSTSTDVFSEITDEQLVEGARRVERITPDQIRAAVDQVGAEPELADTLIARRQNIIDRLLNGVDESGDDSGEDVDPVSGPVTTESRAATLGYDLPFANDEQAAIDKAFGVPGPGWVPGSTDPDMAERMGEAPRERMRQASESVQRATVVVVGESSLFDIIESGRLMSQHETGVSNGAYDPSYRSENESAFLGVPETVAPARRPIFGTVAQWESLDNASMYGDTVIITNPDRVAGRVSFSVGDSLDTNAVPMWPDEVDAASVERLAAAVSNESGPRRYVETQIHGGLSLDDVEAIGIPISDEPGATVADYQAYIDGTDYSHIKVFGIDELADAADYVKNRDTPQATEPEASQAADPGLIAPVAVIPQPTGPEDVREAFTRYGYNPDTIGSQYSFDVTTPSGLAKEVGSTQKAAAAAARQVLKSAVEDARNGHIVVRVPPSAAQAIVQEGRFRSQHEAGTSMASYNPEARSEFESDSFGIPDGLPPAARPIYGMIASDDLAVIAGDRYGSIGFTLRPAVADRTSVSLGDSLNAARPIPLTAVDDATVSETAAAVGFFGHDVVRRTMDGEVRRSFVEAQIHGGVTTADIGGVIVYGSADEDVARELAASLGVPLTVVPDSEYDIDGGASILSAGTLATYGSMRSAAPPTLTDPPAGPPANATPDAPTVESVTADMSNGLLPVDTGYLFGGTLTPTRKRLEGEVMALGGKSIDAEPGAVRSVAIGVGPFGDDTRIVYSAAEPETLAAMPEVEKSFFGRPRVVVGLDDPALPGLLTAAHQLNHRAEYQRQHVGMLAGFAQPASGEAARIATAFRNRSNQILDSLFPDDTPRSFVYDTVSGDFVPAADGAPGAVQMTRDQTWMVARETNGTPSVRIRNSVKNRMLGHTLDLTAVDDRTLPLDQRVAALADARAQLIRLLPGTDSATWFPIEPRDPADLGTYDFASDPDTEAMANLRAVQTYGKRVAVLVAATAAQTDTVSGRARADATRPPRWLAPAGSSRGILFNVDAVFTNANNERPLTQTELDDIRSVTAIIDQMIAGEAAVTSVAHDPDTGAATIMFHEQSRNPGPNFVPPTITTVSTDPAAGSILVVRAPQRTDSLDDPIEPTSFALQLDGETTATILTAIGTEGARLHDDHLTRLAAHDESPTRAAHTQILEALGVDMGTDDTIRVGDENNIDLDNMYTPLAELDADSPMAATVTVGLSVYPRSWTAALARDSRLMMNLNRGLGIRGEGENLNRFGTFVTVPDVTDAPWYADVVGHEFGHSMQRVVVGVKDAEYWHAVSRRLGGETLTKKQVGNTTAWYLKDEWADPYTGRMYDDTWSGTLEVFTTGIQALYDTGQREAATFGADPRLNAFTLGLLAAIDPTDRSTLTATQLLGGSYSRDDVEALLRSGTLTAAQRTELQQILAGMT